MLLKSRKFLLLDVKDSEHPTTGQNILRGVVGVVVLWVAGEGPAAVAPE